MSPKQPSLVRPAVTRSISLWQWPLLLAKAIVNLIGILVVAARDLVVALLFPGLRVD
jgi:hypothetical protein